MTFLMGFGLGAVTGIYAWATITGPPTRAGSWLAGKIRRMGGGKR